uniref:Cilia- and flagella-associated protein 206 n=1 Tax=Clastoptera arizonana TaxID=38151 RepID=A0A1B6EAW1_9HEMI
MNRLIDIKAVLNHIGKEIVSYCTNKGYNVSVDCASRIAELTMLNPDYNFNSDLMSRCKIQQLINFSVDKLTDNLGSCYTTIELQAYFISNFYPREILIVNHRRSVLERTQPFFNDIIMTQTKEINDIYEQLVTLLTLLSGLGNPNVPIVLKEATAALLSVFPKVEITRFMGLTKEEKFQQILELKHIMSGIRLFNKDSKKGGEGIEDLPVIVEQGAVATKKVITNAINMVENDIKNIVHLLDKCYEVSETAFNEDVIQLILQLPEYVTNHDIEKLKSDLILLNQLKVYYKTILDEINDCEKDINTLYSKFKLRLFQLHETVRYRTAIPTGQVYPQFMDLSVIWSNLQDQIMVLSTMHNLFFALQKIATFEPINQEKIDAIQKVHVKEFTTSFHRKIKPSKVKCEVVEFVNISEYTPKVIQFYGNCAFKFVETGGAIIPGDPSIGLLRYNSLLFAFSSSEAAETFGQDPEKYFQSALDIISRKPEIIILFNMDEQIQNMKKTTKKTITESSFKCNAEVQTETHPVESYIDPNYFWNMWDYKRKAIQLTNLKNCLTHSVQTNNSHKRQSIGIQATPMKTTSVQTRKDGSSNFPTLSNFMFGLRGRSDNIQHLLTLTRPVDEFLH